MRLKYSGQRTCRTPVRSATIVVANPFGNSAIAYVAGNDGEGWKCITPMQTIGIKYKQPRTQFITLGVA